MKNKIIIVVSVVIIIAIMGVVLFLKNDDIGNYTNDEIKFKDEYEKLNGQELTEDYILKNVDIDIDNNVKYVNDNNILSLMTEGTNVIYFGWSDCNWCRSIISTLVNTLKENNVETLYYYDFKSLRSSYENNENKDKVELYEKIVEIVGENINSVFDESSKRSGEKKILAPTVIFIKNGELLGVHVKSVDSQIKSTDELTDSQLKELSNIYKSFISQLNSNVCVDEGC